MMRLTLLISLILGLAFTFLVPPFQKPDENRHFYQTAAISRGTLTCQTDSTGQVYLPISVQELELPAKFHFRDLAHTYHVKFYLSYFKQDFSVTDGTLVPEKEWCSWSPIGYLPNVLGYLLGSISGNLLVMFYSARLSSLILFLLVLYVALPLTSPPLRLLLTIYSVLPMTLHQVTSISYDTLILILSPITFALLTKVFTRSKISTKQWLVVQVSVLLTVVSKLAYFPLLLIPLFITKNKLLTSTRVYRIMLLAYILLSIITLAIANKPPWYNEVMGYVNPELQATVVIDNPVYFLQAFIHTIQERGAGILAEMVGRFGWLDYGLEMNWYILAYLVFGGVITYISSRRTYLQITNGQIAILGMIVVSTILCIFGSLYLIWSPVGSNIISGVQGRYLLPIFLPTGLFLISIIRYIFTNKSILKLVITIGILIFFIQITHQIYLRYWDYTQSGYNDILSFQTTPILSLSEESEYFLTLPYKQGKVVGFSYVVKPSAHINYPYRYEICSRDCQTVYRTGYLQTQSDAVNPYINHEKIKPLTITDKSFCLKLFALKLPAGQYLQLLPFSSGQYIEPLYIVSSLSE